MSNTSIKVAIALFMVLATPAASFARGGGGRGGGSATTGLSGGARPNAATGAQIGTQEMLTDPSGVGSASRVAPIAPPRITVPTVPQFK